MRWALLIAVCAVRSRPLRALQRGADPQAVGGASAKTPQPPAEHDEALSKTPLLPCAHNTACAVMVQVGLRPAAALAERATVPPWPEQESEEPETAARLVLAKVS